MEKEELKIKIAEILGVSASEKDLAFEMMLKDLSNLLNFDEAINIPTIGVFSLKKEPLLREERNSKIGASAKRNLIFVPEENALDTSSKAMYLTFNLDNSNEDYLEFDENVFSIGVGKPIVTVDGIQNANPLSENSEKMIATLEEKVQSLVANTERISNYNIWNEITASENETIADDIDSELIENDEDLKKLVSENVENIAAEPNQTDAELNIEDLEDDLVIEESESIVNENDDNITLPDDDEGNASEDYVIEETASEETTSEENVVEETAGEESDTTDIDDSGEESESEEDIDWDWGDELKEELEADAETDIDISPEESEAADEEENDTGNSDIFDRLENDEEDLSDKDSKKIDEDKEEQSEEEDNKSGTVEFTPEDFEEADVKKEKSSKLLSKLKFGKTLWMLIGAFVFIGIIGVYFLFFTGAEEHVETNQTVLPDTLIYKKLKPTESISDISNKDKNQNNSAEKSAEKVSGDKQKEHDNLETVKAETKTNTEKSLKFKNSENLYQIFPDEKQIRNLIFLQNGVYSVQVSSRKDKNKAEQYAKKLRNVGYNAFIVKTYLTKLKSTWYRVRIGFFKTINEAVQFKTENKF